MSKAYWENRAAQRELESQVIASKYLARMAESLREAQQDILRQIETFYARYVNENKVTLTEARKYLTANELKDFKGIDLKRFREMSLSENPEYGRILNAVSYRVRISRLEAMNLMIEMRMAELYGGPNGLQNYAYTGLMDVYQNSYYKTMFDLAKQGIVNGSVAAITDDTMKEVLSYNWSGKEFSDRIWGHQKSTFQSIRKTLERSFAAGHSIDRTTKVIMEVTNVAHFRAEALVRTESNFLHNLAAHNSYVDAGIEKYEILATLDHRTSDICREQDGKIYNDKDFKPGHTAPPFHVRCRTTTIPWFDEPEYMGGEKRQSADGLIDSMTYEEWEKKFVRKETIHVDSQDNEYKVYPVKKSNVNWTSFMDMTSFGSDILNDVHSNLNEFMNTERREKLFILDKTNGSIKAEIEGEEIDKVDLSKETIKLLKKSAVNSLVLSHCHPSPTPFSRDDIRKIIEFASINTLSLECADGSKFLLKRESMKSSIFKTYLFDSIYDKIYWGVAKRFPELEDENKRILIWDEFLSEVNQEIADCYGMTFLKVE
ncbi:phage putative head morphogenesis protein, SPP1 gp7 family [Schinkia azotoformans MEV2011]|uniref:Phage putative head morphogenesis protein, SPP1 gp7 family n=1 Tax=Schinkia azotoformans MEV2011 TaxID=1348973 RepID=A0A072NT62_SCHAZ|nr:minor capsid protein [Schinkia azotoformans]KEF40422.1 phage putative head morphogenesis protein, SPP1 gp7 family [Schinkia azotoformans MEV2011]MEC1696168.1 minor capsid protein [Schinkia azotoformans]MEC1725329.1 minor capsid protein [Schinkia azotoformans]MEC1779440.1 minor capsid protein [Schinkia azotoformans]MED4330075.1 minor capsid protein [Schinkia azotoformans]